MLPVPTSGHASSGWLAGASTVLYMVVCGGPGWVASTKRYACGGGWHALGGWRCSWWLAVLLVVGERCFWWPAFDVMLVYGRAQPVVWMVWTKQNVLQWWMNRFWEFCSSFKSGRSTKRQLFALVSPKDGTKISKSLKPCFEGGQLNILFGYTNSQKIVERVVEVYEFCAVFVIINEESNIADVENK
uniref:Uncharacterized protein n=1 Tax=Meloidogyne enterolobii TaxID=390850 RepID=A0A6V7Y3P7_MELEN|nr:unnamed protein product [Meloidogyne enterolobii]